MAAGKPDNQTSSHQANRKIPAANQEKHKEKTSAEKKKRALLRSGEERTSFLASLVDFSDDATIGKTLDGIITSWNKAAEAMDGYRADEIIGKPIYTLLPPAIPKEMDKLLRNIRKGARVDHYETIRKGRERNRMKNSRILIVEDEAISALDLQHRLKNLGLPPPAIAYTGEEAVQKTLEIRPDLVLMDIKLPGIDGIAAAGQIKSHLDIPIIYVTAYADETTLQRAKITEPYGYIIKPFQERDLVIAIEMALHRHKSEKQIRENEKQLQKAKIELEMEIAERKRAEAALKQSEQLFRSYFESPLLGMAMTSSDKRWIEVNDSLCSMLGYSREELANVTWAELAHPDDLAGDMELLKNILSGRQGTYSLDKRFIRKDGKTIWTSLAVSCLRDAEGKVKQIAAAVLHITERKQAEQALQDYKDELEKKVLERTVLLTKTNESLLAEIEQRKRTERSLLSARKKLRAVASEIVISEERARQNFATNLHDTVVQTLGAAKLRSQLIQDQIPSEARPIFSDMQEMLSQSITQARTIMAEMSPPILYELGFVPALEWLTEQTGARHGIVVGFKRNGDFAHVNHEVQIILFQATRELLMNVVKHSKSRDVIVKFSGNGKNVKIEVKDSGIGFDKKISFRPDLNGGYGLFSIRERLRNIDGDLIIKSRPGRGTTVVITAPKSSPIDSH